MLSALDGHFPSPQPDTRLYCQAAKRIVQGHPFSYSAGESCSTGTTSVLYPFVLAAPYAMGATGDRLLEAGFWINGFFYLVFLLGWTLAFYRWIGGLRGKVLAVALLTLCGQPAICAFAQSDTGFWMATSALLAAVMAWDRWGWVTVLTALSPWVRPEGMYVVAAMLFTGIVFRGWRRRLLPPTMVGLISSLAVFGLNHALTGRFQFDSIGHKGYFNSQPLETACLGVVHDLFILFRNYFIGIDDNWPRMIFSIPIFGGVFLWAGMLSRRWNVKRDAPLVCFGVAVLLSLAVMSTSQQLGQNFERYLAWTTPLFVLFIAAGAVWCFHFNWSKRIRRVSLFLVVIFYFATGISSVLFYRSTSKGQSATDEFYRASEVAMAAEDLRMNRKAPGRVGGYACASLYDYTDRQFRNIAGIYSPEFFDYYLLPLSFELLKHRPDLRFEYWQNYALQTYEGVAHPDDVLGHVLLAGPGDSGIRCANWSAFDCALKEPRAPTNTMLKTCVDIGYLEDERRTGYEVLDRWGRKPHAIALGVARLDGMWAVDSGRIIIGGDSLSVDLDPGRDCHVTIRTLSKLDGVAVQGPIKMLVQVDDVDVDVVTYGLTGKEEEFQERTFVIPGRFISQPTSRISFLGDHIVCGYWFWQ